jgi:hypothetical protein
MLLLEITPHTCYPKDVKLLVTHTTVLQTMKLLANHGGGLRLLEHDVSFGHIV